MTRVFRKVHSLAVVWLLVEATLVVVAIKIAYQLPFRVFKKGFDWFIKPASAVNYPLNRIHQTAWAVNAVSNRMPFAVVCLPRALSLKYLLRQDPRLHLKIGVRLQAGFAAHAWAAHAWVELDGQIVIGDTPETYQSLWIWGEESSK